MQGIRGRTQRRPFGLTLLQYQDLRLPWLLEHQSLSCLSIEYHLTHHLQSWQETRPAQSSARAIISVHPTFVGAETRATDPGTISVGKELK
nr:MAG: hypothetical protein AM324_08125 [Candidatus Thorarchaeota archaeon SMTZ1-83]